MPIPTESDLPLDWYSDSSTGVTSTLAAGNRKKVPAGALQMQIGLFPTTANPSTARTLFVALNALSDSEEDQILSGALSGRIEIPAGFWEVLKFDPTNPLLRYAIATDAATETNGGRVIQRIGREA